MQTSKSIICAFILPFFFSACTKSNDTIPAPRLKFKKTTVFNQVVIDGDTTYVPAVDYVEKGEYSKLVYHYSVDTFDLWGNILNTTWFDFKDSLVARENFEYDKNSNLLTSKFFIGSNLLKTISNKYDDNENLIENKKNYSTSATVNKKVMLYNNNNQIIGSYFYTNDTLKRSEIFKYDSDDRLSECLRYKCDGRVLLREKIVYINEYYVKTDYYYPPSDTASFTILKTYDDNGNQVTMMTLRGSRVVSDRSNFYIEPNLIREEIVTQRDTRRDITRTKKVVYNYDVLKLPESIEYYEFDSDTSWQWMLQQIEYELY